MGAVTIEQLRGETYTGGDPVVEGMYTRNARHLDEVLSGVRDGFVAPLFGAGFSAGSIPLWRGALLGWARELGPAVEADVTDLLDAGDFEGAASLVEIETGANAFRDAFEETFGEGVLDGAFQRLTPERRGITAAFRVPMLTTNYDRLIERAYEAAGAPIERVCPHTAYHLPQAAGGLQGNKPLLLKLHGDACDPTNAVITREDYDRMYGTDGKVAPLVDVMRLAFAGRRVLFLGCSLAGDRPLDVLHGCCEGETHYALVELPAETENPGDPFAPALVDADGRQVPAYRDARLRLDELGIRPIWYPHGQHEALDALLGWLEGEMGPLPGGSSARLAPIPESTYEIVGREGEVAEVVRSLSGGPSITLVTGPGGIGKTEVCREVLRRLQSSGRDVVYAVMVGASTAWAQCDAVAKALGVPGMEQREGVGVKDYARYLTDKLDDLECPVVYLDNWEDAWVVSDEEGRMELISLLRALRDGGSSVLASSREAASDYETGARTIRIHELGKGPSVDLFCKVLETKDDRPDPSGLEFEKLIGELEGHPLAIVLTATLATRALSWDDVLNRWAEASQHAEDRRHDSLETALRLSWDAVADTARTLWGVMALTPGDLPRAELDALASLWRTEPRDWVNAYARLRDASLVFASGDGSLSMLRPVRESFFHLADGGLIDRCLDLLKRRFLGVFEADDNGSGVPGTGDAHAHALASLPRALFFLGRSLGLRGLGAGAPALACALANHYLFDWEASRPVLDALLRVARDAGNKDLYAFAAQTSAECAMHQDRLDVAGRLLEEAEFLHREAGDGLGTANDLQDRAELAMRLGDLDVAGRLLEEAERLHREAGSTLGMANDLKNRVRLLALQGDYDRALSELAKAEELYEGMGDEYSLNFAHELLKLIEQAIAEE